ncbi:hypothetical protein QYF36_020708 [Acer negundo]|nr:hypothetical protein QYF36_020708 [Acer negundo]
MLFSKAKDSSYILQKLGILASFCSLYITYKADWGDLFTYNSVENFIAMASFVDEQDGVVRLISDAPPTHYKLKIQLFSLLVKNAVEKYESAEFEAGGYKWKLVLYPNGNKSKNVKDHISLYLTLADTSSLPPEVFVTKERGRLKEECLSMIKDTSSIDKDTSSIKHAWKIENFSKLNAESYFSEAFSAGGHKWKIKLYPKGMHHLGGNHLSLFLALVDFTPDSKVYTDFTLRILDQLQDKHISFKDNHCFTASMYDWGWRNFVTCSYFKDPGNGCLVKDICLVEAVVTVWGCQGSTTK